MMKQVLRNAAFQLGAFQLVQKLHRNRARILMFHRFPKEHARNFEQQCSFLRDHYDVVSLSEMHARLTQGASLENLLAITIDDGYADVYRTAQPILRKYQLPGTLFVTTGFIDRTCWMAGDASRVFFEGGRGLVLEIEDDAGRKHTFVDTEAGGDQRLRSLLKGISNGARSRALNAMRLLREAAGGGTLPAAYAPCTWEELRMMADDGIEMGAHTKTHPILSRVDDEASLEEEIAGSKKELEAKLGRPVASFAYPNGGPADISPAAFASVKQHFRVAVTAVAGMNGPETDPYQLRRLPAEPEMPVDQMARMLAGPLRPQAANAPLVFQPAR